jgi:phosphatidylserine/phosphatidylglycerophosphate/cardiolipin synthase-like enzyme
MADNNFPLKTLLSSRSPLKGLGAVGLLIVVGVVLLVQYGPQWLPKAKVPPAGAEANVEGIEVYFSPRGGCTEAIVQQLDAAKSSVLVQAYSFTSDSIAEAIVEAHKRGVRVEVILDRSQLTEKYCSADFVAHAGIPVAIDAKHAIAHNKIMVIDGETVITGSFNFTKQAEHSNAENLLVIRSRSLAETYTANWKAHARHSEPYAGKG